MIEVRDVSYSLNDTLILDGIDWTIDRGQRWGLLGPSGAGKTSLMRIISGHLHPNAGGKVFIEGNPTPNLARWRRRIGWVSTDLLNRIPLDQPLVDTVVAGKHSQSLKAERSGLDYHSDDEKEARKLLRRVGLDERNDQSFGKLSQGERQLALAARSFMNDPSLIILDEPCAGLDPGAREDFLDQLTEILHEDTSTSAVYVTHHVEELLPVFPNVLALKNGRIIASDERGQVLKSEIIKRIYGCPFTIVRRNNRFWPVGVE